MTPENFLKIISGDAKSMKGIGSGRVLQTGPDDHIFINFVDHGAPWWDPLLIMGLLAFPSSELHAQALQDTLLDMYHQNRYDKLVMYIEACESGSMFEDLLPENLNSKFNKTIYIDWMLNFACINYSFCHNSFKSSWTLLRMLLWWRPRYLIRWCIQCHVNARFGKRRSS